MDNLKYFPFYYNRFMDGVRGYDAEFIGIYIMLLCRQAETFRIEKDILKLSRWMGGISSAKIENVLAQKFLSDEHGFFNIVMDQVLEEVAKKSESARKSANDRWNKIRTQCERNANASKTHPKSDANDMLIKESKEKEKKKKIIFARFWDLYDKKVDKHKCIGYWEKLTDDEIELIFKHIPLYKISQPDKQFRKDPKTYLYNRSWENEIIDKTTQNAQSNGRTRTPYKPATIEDFEERNKQPIVAIKLGDYQHLIKEKNTGNTEQ